MNDPDFNLLAALDPLPVSQAWHPRLEQAPATAGCGSGCVRCVASKKKPAQVRAKILEAM